MALAVKQRVSARQLRGARFITNPFTNLLVLQDICPVILIGGEYHVGRKTFAGDIFEFGFSDSILQMWAAFLQEIEGIPVVFGCFTPEETRLSHALLTAALQSHASKNSVALDL